MRFKFSLMTIIVLALLVVVLPTQAQEEEELITVAYINSSLALSFSYDATWASAVTTEEIEEAPYTGDEMPLWAANPAYTLFTFEDFAVDGDFFMPAQIRIYRTETFADYSLEDYGMEAETQKLSDLLEEQAELESAPAHALDTGSEPLPYLPMVGAAQGFYAKPVYVEFEGGAGVRYLTYYALDVSPITEGRVFYTFQGITDDGLYYIAVNFPTLTELLMEDADLENLDYEAFVADFATYFTDTITSLDEQLDEDYIPGLGELDALVASISINSASDD